MRTLTTLLAAALIVLPVSALTACAPDAPAPAESAEVTEHAAPLTLADGWAKAAASAGMTGVFGTLHNPGSADLTITGVESAAAGMIELHEVTADGVMQKIPGDVVVPAHGSLVLAPGANHIMLMQLQQNLLAGDQVTFTLQLKASDGTTSSAEFSVLVKDYAGANENYGGADHGGTDHGGTDHGDQDHGSH